MKVSRFRCSVLAAAAFIVPLQVWSWGGEQQPPSFCGGSLLGIRRRRKDAVVTLLKAGGGRNAEWDDDDELFFEPWLLDSFRATLERDFERPSYFDQENEEKLSQLKSLYGLDDDDEIYLQDGLSLTEQFAVTDDDDSCATTDGTDDPECEEDCLIPESYKIEKEDIDVMAFLGIRRVKPLTVDTSSSLSWE